MVFYVAFLDKSFSFQDLYCVRSDLGNLLKALGRLDEAKVWSTGVKQQQILRETISSHQLSSEVTCSDKGLGTVYLLSGSEKNIF